jgi:hypothetical protein
MYRRRSITFSFGCCGLLSRLRLSSLLLSITATAVIVAVPAPAAAAAVLSLLQLSKLLCASVGKVDFSMECWDRAVQLERQRRARVVAMQGPAAQAPAAAATLSL